MFNPLENLVTHQLPNGLRILFKEDHTSPLVSVHTWIRAGSVDETNPQSGIAHILEHMLFKGTTHLRAAEISRWVEDQGGAMNAETSREYTHYYVDVLSAGARKAVYLLGEMMHRATLDPNEWKRERLVILEEIKRRNDDPESLLWDLLNESLFNADRLKRPVIGTVDTVSQVTRDQLDEFYRTFYRAGSSVVVVAGDFKPRVMLEWIHAAFDAMPRGNAPLRPSHEAESYCPKHLTMQRPVKQAYVALGFPTPPSAHPDHDALDILAAVLGEGRSSRLVQTLREKKKIVWSVGTANYGHEGPGIFSVFAECESSKRRQLRSEVERLFRALDRPKPEELTRAKNMIRNAWMQGFETYHHQASILGLYALDHQLERLKTYLPRIAALTATGLADTAERYLHQLPLSTAVVDA